ncbi:MAG: alpha/beta hydrolase [Pseudomonadota bacterium]
MPVHPFAQPAGRVEYIQIESTALTNNLLGDPTTRTVAVYLPPGYDQGSDEFPLFVDIVGFTGSGLAHVGWKAFAESVPQRVDRLVAEGKMGPVIVALPDCFTALGGNQYINSAAMGNWADFLTAEMVPAIEARFRVRKGAASRALFGKSSGGYGAIVHGLKHAEHWGAVACHSGDMAFEWCYLGDLPKTVMHLAGAGGSAQAFLERIRRGRKMSGSDFHHLMMLAMAATYDPDPSQPYGVRLPVTSDTCEIIEDRWANWLAWDPVRLARQEQCLDNLRSLRGIYIDCGSNDQYNLVFGARQLSRCLVEQGVRHRFEEFDDNHSSVDYRMDESLPFLYDAVTG